MFMRSCTKKGNNYPRSLPTHPAASSLHLLGPSLTSVQRLEHLMVPRFCWLLLRLQASWEEERTRNRENDEKTSLSTGAALIITVRRGVLAITCFFNLDIKLLPSSSPLPAYLVQHVRVAGLDLGLEHREPQLLSGHFGLGTALR